MSLESIIEHIISDASAQREKIIQEAQKEAQKIIQEARKQAEGIYQEILEKERIACENQRQRLLVNARLEQKKNLLSAKQELINLAFENLKSGLKKDKFKKQQVSYSVVREVEENIDFYLGRIKLDHEIEISGILFE